MIVQEYADRDMLAISVADAIASDLNAALNHEDRVTLAVPGGTTPGPVFDVLGSVQLDWDRVNLMLTDERWVPEGHERSNTSLLKKRLLTGPAARARFVPFVADGAPEETVPRLGDAVATCLPLTVLVLGMGGDMHTASLFPGAPGLEEALSTETPLSILRPASEPDIRVSLSGPVLAGAVSKHLLITGTDKRAALERAAHLSPQEAPIQVAMQDLTVHWAE